MAENAEPALPPSWVVALAEVGDSRERFLTALQLLHQGQGYPSSRAIEQASKAAGQRISRQTAHNLLLGTTKPLVRSLAGFLHGCKVPEQLHKAWIEKCKELYPTADRRAGARSGRVSARRSDRPSSCGLQQVGILPGSPAVFQRRALADSLAHPVTTMDTAGRTLLLSGMGGVGKTQLAVDLAVRLRDTGQLDLLVWITAASRQAITAGYAQAAVDLSLPGADGTDVDRDAGRFHAWLSTTDRRWLVVLDDLGTTADLQGLWPPIPSTGLTVVTTHLRGRALAGPGRHLIPVGGFTPTEAAAYLQLCLAKHPDLADDIDGLANALYHLPLALAHATAYMIDEGIPCTVYQRRLAKRDQRLDDLAPPDDGLPGDYTRTVTATVSLSVLAADQRRPVGLADPLLHLASVLDPAGIPVSVFTTTLARERLSSVYTSTTETGDPRDVDVDTVRSGLQCLHRLNLVTVNDEMVAVHGLVQRVVREDLPSDRFAELVRTAADALMQLWPVVEQDRTIGQALRINALAVHQHGGGLLWHPDVHPIMYRIGASLGEAGMATDAIDHWRHMHDLAVQHLGPDHRQTFKARRNLARWYGEAGNPTKAVTISAELLADIERVLGPDDPDTLVTRYRLVYWRAQAGNNAGAKEDFIRLLDDQLRALGPEHTLTLATRRELACLIGQTGNAEGAVTALVELLTDMERLRGPDHPDTQATRTSLAAWRGHAGHADGAATAYAQQLEDRLRMFGPKHQQTLSARRDLAYWRGRSGDVTWARDAYPKLLADCERVLGADHPDTLNTRHSMARWEAEAGDAAKAIAIWAQLVEDQARVLGPEHPNTIATQQSLIHWSQATEQPGDHPRR